MEREEEEEGEKGQVTIQISRQEHALEALSDTVGRLEEHLSGFLLIQPGTEDAHVPEQELVPLAVRIRANLRHIEEQDARLKDIIARLEI